MTNYLKRLLDTLHTNAAYVRRAQILSLLEKDPKARVIDLGCDDGKLSLQLMKKIHGRKIYGIDIIDRQLKLAKNRGVITKKHDLNQKFPYKKNYFDVIHADQVIEHIAYLDTFVSEIYRVLRPGGYIIISTENASSWHNIFAAVLGWQIFSLTNVSTKKSGIGNPFAIHRNAVVTKRNAHNYLSWTHKTIFNYRGLKEFFEAYDFVDVTITGSGYYPLPASFGKFDPRHSHFITLKAYKPKV